MTFDANITLASNSTTQGQENASTLCFVNDPNSIKLGRVIAYSTLILISLIGNVLTVTAILQRQRRTRKTITYSVVNMTVANLVITVSYMPRLIPMFLIGVEWLIVGPLGYALCKLVPFLHGVAIVASILNLLFTSLDMFLVVVFPMKRFSSTKAARLGVLLTWTLAIIARLPYLIALRTKVSKQGLHVCSSSLSNAFGNGNEAREIYYTVLLITFYAIPWVAIFCFYLAIVVILGKGQTPGQRNATAICVREARVKAVRSIMKMMVAITFMFLTCWITYFSAMLAFKTVPCSFRFWRMFLAHSNCAISPILVASFNKNIRKGIKTILYKSKLFYCIRSSSRVARFSLRGPTSFSVNEYMDVADFGRINRRGVIRWKRGSVDLANVNEGICTSSVRETPILTFKTLQKDQVNKPNDDQNGKNANHAEVNPAFRNA